LSSSGTSGDPEAISGDTLETLLLGRFLPRTLAASAAFVSSAGAWSGSEIRDVSGDSSSSS
jgi:hypothetical protein